MWRAALIAGALALAWAGTAACHYRFGISDQAQYLVRYTALRHPGALAGDPYLEAIAATRSWAWDPIARWVTEPLLPAVALGLTLASAAASALVLAWLASALLGGLSRRTLAGAAALLAPAMALVVPKELNWFGLVALSDVEWTATLAAVPLALLSAALFIRGRAWWALVVAGAILPVHGQTAAYALTAWVVASAWVWRGSPGRLAGVLGVLGLGVIAFLTQRGGVGPGSLDAYRQTGLRLYAPLIDPARAPAGAWAACAAVCSLGLLAWPGLVRLMPGNAAAGRLGVYWAATLALPLAGAGLIALGWQEPLLWKLMPGRGLMLTQLLALAVVAVWAAGSVLRGGRGAWLAGASLGLVVVWPFPALGAVGGGVCFALLGVGIVAAQRLDMALPAQRVTRPRAGLLLGGPALAALTVGAVAFAGREHSWLEPAHDGAWAHAQAWARANTPEGSVFVTPPYRAGWRVGSHRQTYGELRDGGLFFYAGEPVLAWADRMQTLGMNGYGHAWSEGSGTPEVRGAYARALRERADRLAAAGVTHLVCEAGHAPGAGVLLWSNSALEVWRLDSAVTAGSAAPGLGPEAEAGTGEAPSASAADARGPASE